jgi:tungstate transport system ATP-binding protein
LSTRPAGPQPAPPAGNAIDAAGLVVRYGRRTVIDIGQLTLRPGRTLALLGPNGAGKSTLLRVLALLERPSGGRLSVLGEAATDGERQRLDLRRRMATVFQAPLLTDQTVIENVALGLRFRGIRGADAAARAHHWLERLGIAQLATQQARTLSGGEAQRTSLARAFVLEPELLFLDEPFASLDQHGREALSLELDAILRESRIATVLVTHDRSEAMMLADEVAVLMDGRVCQHGELHGVMARPATEQVARFLGVENLLPARVLHRHGNRGTVELAGQRVEVQLPDPAATAVLLCLRAEDVHLSLAGTTPETGNVRLAARVERVLAFGVPYRVQLDAGVPLVALAARRTVERLTVASGTRLVASFDPEAVHAVAVPGSEVRSENRETEHREGCHPEGA